MKRPMRPGGVFFNRLVRSRAWKLNIALAAGLIVYCLVIVLRKRQEEPIYAVRQFHECLERSDSACLASLMLPDETRYGPSPEQLDRFIREVFRPKMHGYKPVGPLEFEPGTDSRILVDGSRKYVDSEGRVVYVGVAGYRTESKAAAWPMFVYLVLPLLQTYRTSPGEPSRIYWSRGIRDLRPKLEQIGIKGVFFNTGQSQGEFLTWEQWLARLRK